MRTRQLRRFPPLSRSARQIRREIDEEIEFHLEARTTEMEGCGLDRATARDEALRLFGDVEDTRSACVESDMRRERQMRRKERFADLAQDLTHGMRQLRRRPLFAMFHPGT